MCSKATNVSDDSSSAASSRSESPVATVKHQRSFEERYADIINQQILENSINKEVLQRQVQAFFPINSRKTSTSNEQTKGKQNCNQDAVQNQEQETNDHRKCLEKLQTLDIKDAEKGDSDWTRV